ncbi:NifB/NifX family molybdenum-iron cluster-binding protein [Desulfatitalea tepidiphila]|uniref:NifB/NifX family molybdenum-iron cluster-binding protein n=1 Tax=Desulfatitalea tepidiphila TaxID=1185843 RepID=UPI000A891519|nr:hypothetical protein [Desulfatitalea tepidiphila]
MIPMNAAFTTWNSRIAPVFDVARTACIVEVDQDGRVSQRMETFKDDLPAQKVLCLVQWKIESLVCGAISRSLQLILAAQAIRVIPFVAGDLQEVIGAWLKGSIEDAAFAMPGYGGRRHRKMGGAAPIGMGAWVLAPEETQHPRGGGRRRGQPHGQGRSVRSAGGVEECLCPKCGRREPRQTGMPCTMLQCRTCGTAMVSSSYHSSKPRR